MTEHFDPAKPSIMENVAVYGVVRVSDGSQIIDCWFHNSWLAPADRPRWLPQWAFDWLLRLVTQTPDEPAITIPVVSEGVAVSSTSIGDSTEERG